MDEREAYVALNMMERVGPVAVRGLVERLGSARAVFDAPASALREARGVGPGTADAIVAGRGTVVWQAELERVEQEGLTLLTPVDAEYPELLAQIHDPPLALYVRGALTARDRHGLAVVGTRHASHYGLRVAGGLSAALARAGWTIVSGLARGIDTAAHEGALKAGGRTVAVLGGGHDHVYPPDNAGLAESIAAQGAVLSEFPFGRQPDRTTFPMRNRIVSGLSRGVLVVEAGAKSGALITVDEALAQGRTVFAVPGRIDAPGSRGPNSLIRQGARLVMGADDVLDEFDWLMRPPAGPARAPESERAALAAVSAEEQAVLDLLEPGEQDVDALIRASGLSAARMSVVLLGLEMKRAVRMLPGRLVERVCDADGQH
jgi:DNA processing protein